MKTPVKVEFLTTIDVRYIDGVKWQLTAPYYAVVTHKDDSYRIIKAPSGFITDFASIPRMPLVFLRFAGMAGLPALAHDVLYSEGGSEDDRTYADLVFLQGMIDSGMDKIDANAMFQAVRVFGLSSFNKTC